MKRAHIFRFAWPSVVSATWFAGLILLAINPANMVLWIMAVVLTAALCFFFRET